MMEDDHEICRVCRCESTHDHPLFHPCKCSGSIRFVHQDCLLEWLSHSKKKYCELCEYPFTFTPIYRDDMPDRIPIGVLVRQCARRCGALLWACFRAALVVVVWLVILPFLTLCTWRFYFWSGESIGFAKRLAKNATLLAEESLSSSSSLSSSLNNATVSSPTSSSILFGYSIKGFLSECFEGQIITAFVIIVFVAAYLFREWVIQNTPAETGIEMLDDNEEFAHDHNNDNDDRFAQQQAAVDLLFNVAQTIQPEDDATAQQQEDLTAHLADITRQLERRRRMMGENQRYRTTEEINGAVELPPTSSRSSSSSDNTYSSSNNHDHDDNDDDYLDDSQPTDENVFSSPEPILEQQNEATASSSSNNTIVSSSATATTSRNKGKTRDDRGGAFFEEINESAEEEEDLASSSRQSLLASWRDEHNRREDASSKLRWRAPEFADSPDADIPGNHFPAADEPLLGHHDEEDDDEIEEEDGDEEQHLLHHHLDNDIGAREQQQQQLPNIRNFAPAPPPPRPAREQWDNGNDNRDNAVDDEEPFDLGEDIDGVLEAIGMRGSMWMLLQNSVLMSLMISLCLGVAVWIPYVIGRLVILIRPISFLKTPISILRFITDHIVDFTLDYGMPYTRSKIAWTAKLLPENVQVALKIVDGYITDFFAQHSSLYTSTATVMADSISASPTATTTTAAAAITTATGTSSAIHTVLPIDIFAWSGHLVVLQEKVEIAASMILERWHRFALGQSGLDRSICILMGYTVLVVVGSWYLARARRVSSHNAAGNSVNDIIRQQGVFLKVFFFIVLELVVFPTVCGVLIDIATFPLFEDATIAGRWEFFRANPYSVTFLHWFIGTGFMFHFAVFITLVRETVRPGVMWFIRDPNDPQFHPVQEMIERPVLTLIRKIGSSALMYCILIVVGIGAVTLAVSQYTGVYPLRWSFDAPLSTLALDLIAVQFLVPPLVSHIKPRDFCKKVMSDWWRAASRHLRLTSFMFNGRYPEEEGSHVRKTFTAWLLRRKAPINTDVVYADVAINNNNGNASVIFKRDGTLARVPKHDSVPVPDNRRMIVPVDPINLEPINENERRLGHPAAVESGDLENNTTIIYIPPNFRLRVASFVFLLWVSGSVLTCSLTVAPLLLGRHVFEKYLAGTQVHDMYAFIVGAYIMMLLSTFINWIGQKYDVLARSHGDVDISATVGYIKQNMKKFLKGTYLAATFGFTVPLLLGILADVYIFMPIRYSSSNDALVIHVSEDWSFGVVFMGIFYGVVYILPDNPVQRYIDGIVGGNVWEVDAWKITRSSIAPLVATSIAAIVVPGLLSVAAVRLFNIYDGALQLALFRCAYPVVFCLAILVGTLVLSTKLFRIWLKAVRDDTYLIGKRLHNLDER
ncbi:hypothetical protein BDB00DRAFT_836412 [Zychaea mexicana]|uniref:uncharacterized protein n=1 Tax=Zychaea mexicana TaxID=64656 RepID=UPI0022FEB307|nr:uncharacterized protein BDB00DRAFT_836412 [Zychaea mexicana]KAI9490702.1 hypothetical protein BDB00DRAFT_836412 [Zychaea mexicana]